MNARAVGCVTVLAMGSALSRAQLATPAAVALGEATVASGQVWGAGTNPAAGQLTDTKPRERRLSIQAYGLSLASPAPLTRAAVEVAVLSRENTTEFELGVQHFTPPGFAVSAVRFGARRQLAGTLFVGLRLGALLGDYDEYGRETLALAEGGLQYGVTRTLTIGADYAFATRAFVPMAQQRLRVGIAYVSSPQLTLLASAAQAVAEPLNGQLGIDYAPAPRLRLRAGYQTLGQRLSFGTGYALENGLRAEITIVAYSRIPLGVVYGIGY